MTEFDNNLSGALFKNDKDGNESRPDYRGSAEIDRAEYWVSAWIKTSKKGEKFMSLRFERKQSSAVSAHRGAAAAARAQRHEEADLNDQIPF